MVLWTALIFGAMLCVAYANGANDTFKGVATLFGSGTTNYKKALWWATATTLAGSIAAVFLATTLVHTFRGQGLIPATLAGSEPFVVAVLSGTALTVFFASKIGTPISTTHSLTGALLGAGLVAVGGLDLMWGVFLVAVLMALGGLLHAQRVAETMSKRITAIDPDQGVIANLVTSVLVICASRWGLPVSTTHVSCGALFGIGAANGKAHWGVVRNIVLAWVVTLPLAALLAAGIYVVLQRLAS